ncbi:glycosyltransferase family 4 protein [Pseudoalteromonas sp. T1lg88]|uniref:glycosyltransferase family 4 protein n=1 Tax=Pseudoalteromonas sp. T1lg88 TaxID=2077104 RepID=UPI000CF617E0|nr:glycosyltransferase [Pseudoalteromonas sp. T1lg88]
MPEIVAFVGETFNEVDGSYYATPTSAAFLQDCFGQDNVKVCSPVDKLANPERLSIQKSSTCVSKKRFYIPPLPANCTTKDFYKNALLRPGFFRSFINFCDEVIAENPHALFWARTPSPGSIIFALRVIKAGKPLLHHICGDARHTWKDRKYRGINKLLALVFSFIVRLQINYICKYEGAVNLASGSELEKWAKTKAPSRTHQFVDMMTKSKSVTSKQSQSLKTILFVGRVVHDKGVFEILEAMGAHPHISLTVVGEGPDLEQVKAVVAESPTLKSRVKFEGQVAFNKLPKYFESADCVVIASKTNEGFPRVIMESWVHKTPLIVSQVGGISAFVKDKYNAVVVKPGSPKEIAEAFTYLSVEENYQQIKDGVDDMVQYSLQSYWVAQLKDIVNDNFKDEAF